MRNRILQAVRVSAKSNDYPDGEVLLKKQY